MYAATDHDCQVHAYVLMSNHIHLLQIFWDVIGQKKLYELREATKKGWTIGDSKFKQAVALQLARKVEPIAKGGDRKSIKYVADLVEVD